MQTLEEASAHLCHGLMDRRSRWRTCLHEAGHVVAARRLFGRAGGAAVFEDGSGVADVGRQVDVPASFKDALATAAGAAAESLGERYSPPPVPMPVPLEVAYPEAAGRLKADVAMLMPDEVAIARWCIHGREGEPDLWARRHGWVQAAAQDFIAEHRHEIVDSATALFGRGIVRLPALPGKGVAHVD
jgi:hypothetical protein